MIRHRCAACGRRINRTDHFFEPSDGTLCSACMEAQRLPRARLRRALGPADQGGPAPARPAPPPAWACLPRLRCTRA